MLNLIKHLAKSYSSSDWNVSHSFVIKKITRDPEQIPPIVGIFTIDIITQLADIWCFVFYCRTITNCFFNIIKFDFFESFLKMSLQSLMFSLKGKAELEI